MILFVCTGNTCRSPMAAAMAAKMLADAGVECAVQSAGIAAQPDCCASTHAITAMREEGCDLLEHSSQRVTEELILRAELVLTMTAAHRGAVLRAHPKAADKVFILYEYAENGSDVSDPFGGDYAVYRECAAQIKELLVLCIKKYIKRCDDNGRPAKNH